MTMPALAEQSKSVNKNPNLDKDSLFDVSDCIAVVTGGGSGIGSMMANALAANGAKVYILGRRLDVLQEAARSMVRTNNDDSSSSSACPAFDAPYSTNEQSPQRNANHISLQPGTVHPLQCSVTSPADLQAAVDAITRSDGHINLLINNAGIATPNLGPHASRPTPKWDIARVRDYWFAKSFEDYAAVLETNTTAALQSTFAFLGLLDAGNKVRAEREMEKKKREEAAGGSGGNGGGGSPPSYVRSQVITMSSVGGFGRDNSAFIYGASKAGVTHMMKNLATYLVPWKIRVNVVAPGCKCSPSIGSLMKPP